jgi:hypothetical protein
MAQVSRQIGWSNESNLLYQILKQLNKLTSVLFGLKEAATPKYKVYTVLLSQNGGANPEVNSVLEDTINQPFTFTYEEQGGYRISSSAFNNENLLKTSITLSQSVEQRIVNIQSNTLGDGYVYIYCQAIGGGRADDGIYYSTLEIRVYN